MIFLPHISPRPALQAYVKNYFLFHINLKDHPADQRIKPIPPDAEQSIIFYPRSKVSVVTNKTREQRASPSSIFVGQQTSRVNIQMNEDHLIIQVYLRPGVLHQLLDRMPIIDFSEKELDTRFFPDHEMDALNDQLAETTDHMQMIAHIEDYLVRKIGRLRIDMQPIDKAIAYLKYNPQPVSLDWLADQACLSVRQFERSFKQRMGMSPKFYARIVRFDRVYKDKLRQPGIDWLDLAYRHGFFDFSHLVRDFRQFAEVTPSMMITLEEQSPGSPAIS